MLVCKKRKRFQKIVTLVLMVLLPVFVAAWGSAGLCNFTKSTDPDMFTSELSLPTQPGEHLETHTSTWSDLSAKAETDYKGDGLFVEIRGEEARLRSLFQALEAEVSSEGLRVISTSESEGRGSFTLQVSTLGRSGNIPMVPAPGIVSVESGLVKLDRGDIVEEYSVSINGIRQDFILATPPPGNGEVRLELHLLGIDAEETGDGALLTLPDSGRALTYTGLYVTDALGRELSARLTVESPSRLVVLVDDSDAVYPVRIDPTISDADWLGMGEVPGPAHHLTDLALDSKGNIYVAARPAGTNYVAQWNGSAWSTLASSDVINALLVDNNDNLYIGGYFTSIGGIDANSIVKYNGATWSNLGAGIGSEVRAMALDSQGNLYAGGRFIYAAGIEARSIAKWNGTAWSTLGSGFEAGSTVYTLAVDSNDILYAGGDFLRTFNDVTVKKVAKWDGKAWSPLGMGTDNTVFALVVDSSDNLYVGGHFTKVYPALFHEGITVNRVARWDGTAWSGLGTGMDSLVRCLALDSADNLYAGGRFTTAGGKSANYIARWNGTAWNELGDGRDRYVSAIAVAGINNIYVACDTAPNHFSSSPLAAQWSNGSWTPVRSRFNGKVNALTVGSDGKIYAGGDFTTAGNVKANRVAVWNGSNWSPVGSIIGGPNGVNGSVFAIAVTSRGELYVGGDFTEASGVAATNIARFGKVGQIIIPQWSALGTGVNQPVFALKVSGSNVYAAGAFTTAGGNSANRIASWNGTTWSALGTGMNNTVRALTLDQNNNIFAGGQFTTAGGNSANRIARWNGTTWSALGTGMNSHVHALAVDNNNYLYAGGSFNTAGGVSANRIAKWDGSAWSPLGTGIVGQNITVQALAINPWGDIYAGGYFRLSDDAIFNNIAWWNGMAWQALGSGTNNSVNALALDAKNNLYVGGNFIEAGGSSTHYMAACKVPSTFRIAGSNRYVTAVEISKKGWPGGTKTVLLARADDFADALAGVPLAYHLDAPILLTATSRLSEATKNEIKRLNAGRVILLGGLAAISSDVQKELESLSLTVDRIAGGNRYETAVLIAEELKAEGAVFNAAFIAVGSNFADAMAASSYAARRGQPILLTTTSQLPSATKLALDTLGISSTFVCGGEAVISPEVFALLPNPERISGSNRYETGIELAKKFLPAGTTHVCVATGLNFPDAIAGGVLAAKLNTGILLVPGDSSAPSNVVQEFITTRKITSVTLFGGSSVISSNMETWFNDNLSK